MRLRALQARGPSGSGIRPGAKRPHAIQFATADGLGDTAGMQELPPSNGRAPPEAVQRRVERRMAQRPLARGRSVPSLGDAHAPRRGCAGTPPQGRALAPFGAPPLGLRGAKPAPAKAGGTALPRRETRRPPWRRPKAAADFARLFDIVNRMRALRALAARIALRACGILASPSRGRAAEWSEGPARPLL